MPGGAANHEDADRIRLDKWLWAARFFKTRALAKQAIDGGKVQCDGNRAKPGKDVSLGMVIALRQGFEDKTVVVKGLSDRRRGASDAQQLYEETPQSMAARKQQAELRKLQPRFMQSEGRPSKRDRRLIHRLKMSGQD